MKGRRPCLDISRIQSWHCESFWRVRQFCQQRPNIARQSAEDIRADLPVASRKLLRRDLLPNDLLPTTPKQSGTGESAA